MASLEQRVRHLLPGKGRKEKHCLVETALTFARCRDRWLPIEDLGNLMKGSGKKYSKSALYAAVGELSSRMGSLGGRSYIDNEPIGIGSGSPMKFKLSCAAFEKIFVLVTPEQTPSKPHLRGLKGRGRIKIPPLVVEKEHEKMGLKYKQKVCFPPQKIINLVEQKIGLPDTNRLLKRLTSNQGICGGYAVKCDSITETHRWGTHPKQQFELTDSGLRKFLADHNELSLEMRIHIVDSKDDARVQALEERALKGDQAAFDGLIRVLSSDTSRDARREAACSLGRLHDRRALEMLIKAMLEDEYNFVRGNAADVLGNIGDPKAIPPLTKACNDPDLSVREMAKKALEKMREKTSPYSPVIYRPTSFDQ